jgi:hypothetical protein
MLNASETIVALGIIFVSGLVLLPKVYMILWNIWKQFKKEEET